MVPHKVIAIAVTALLFFIKTATAFNITRLLDNHPEYSTFNSLLSQSGVASAINSRRTITVLVVANADIGGLSGKPLATVRNILATHVILDYFDLTKLGALPKKTTKMTTLFQSSGAATGDQGFLNVTTTDGEIVFGSAFKGAPHNAKLVKSVAAQPFNISVLQISKVIETPGLDQTAPVSPTTAPSTTPKVAPTKAPAPTPKKASSTPAPSPAESPADEVADAPVADAPDRDAPASGPSPNLAPGPSDDEAADDESPAKEKKSSDAHVSGAGMIVVALMGVVATLVAF